MGQEEGNGMWGGEFPFLPSLPEPVPHLTENGREERLPKGPPKQAEGFFCVLGICRASYIFWIITLLSFYQHVNISLRFVACLLIL
jgi:hypothetical protein